jgi:NTE family protein
VLIDGPGGQVGVVPSFDPPRDPGSPPRVGLVLGAGGVVGQAFEAGVLAALAHDLGWDPRSADLIVGTSAGSITGTLLRLGVSAHDLAAWAVEAPLSGEARLLQDALDDDREFPPPSWGSLWRWRPPSAALLARAVRRPWRFRLGVAAMTMLPTGRQDIEERCRPLDDLSEDGWPDRLWICTVRREDGQRRVFGHPGTPVPALSQAVAASCAIPGYFRPVSIQGRDHLDGGVHSGTNADVVRDEGLDLVIAVAPMSVANGWAKTPDAAMRRSAHRRLERELRSVRAAGTAVVRFEPTPEVLGAMGLNLMATDRSARVVQEAFFAAGARLAEPLVAERLRGLAGPRVAA